MSVDIEVPEELHELLRKKAYSLGKTIPELLLDLITDITNRETRVKIYEKLHEKYMREAEELYRGGELVQASEKYWGTVTTLLNIIGELEGLPHYRHIHYSEIISYITEKTGDRELPRLFASAERLHANYYHGFLKSIEFEVHREDVLKLVQKLKNYISKVRT